MKWTLTPRSGRGLLAAFILGAGLSACGKSSDAEGADGAGSGSGATTAERSGAPVQTQPANPDPCRWMTQAEVEAVVGPLVRAPVRSHAARDEVTPSADGEICSYVVRVDTGRYAGTISESGVRLEVATHDGAELTAGYMGVLRSTALNVAGRGPGDSTEAGPWDQVASLGGSIFAARQGDAAVTLTSFGRNRPKAQLRALAARVLPRVSELPTAAPRIAEGADRPETPAHDPCSLLTTAEAEAVLGKLTAPPYASRTSTSMADGDGGSCAYRTAGHHVLLLTPTWEGGQTELKLASVATQRSAKFLGATAEVDTLDGPWDQVAAGPGGTAYFLKGDALLSIQYNTSSAGVAGAVALARIALAKL